LRERIASARLPDIRYVLRVEEAFSPNILYLSIFTLHFHTLATNTAIMASQLLSVAHFLPGYIPESSPVAAEATGDEDQPPPPCEP